MTTKTDAEVEATVSDTPATEDADTPEESEAAESEVLGVDVITDIQVRDMAKREIDVRVLPWDTVIDTLEGTEEFRRGAFDHVDPKQVLLMGLEHEAHLGVGQNGQPVLTRHPVGKGVSYANEDDGPHMAFRVAKTQRGDEVLALAAEGIVTGVSPEFRELPNGTITERRNGRRHRIHVRSDLIGLSTTYRPAYGERAAVLAVRSQHEKEDASVATEPVAPEAGAVSQPEVPALETRITEVFENFGKQLEARSAPVEALDKIIDRLEKIEEHSRMAFEIPSKQPPGPPEDFHTGDWMKLVLRSLSGEVVASRELETRVAADLVTADNLGVIPPMFTGDVRETIETSRPFLESTRQLTIPRSGMQLTVPVITTRPTVGVQTNEKDELVSTITEIEPANFNPTSIGGYGDISLQLLKRSDPSYLELYLDLLGEAYGIMADDKAVDALLAGVGVNAGGTLDPENLTLGTAWANAAAVSRRLLPDRIWLSTTAVAAFIDAKRADGTTPMYSELQGNFTAAGGAGGTISGLRPVHVPALDDEAVDVVVGPSRGFGWSEDGTYTLQVDVPAKAGRDVGLIGMVWYAPLYPSAFTTYTLPGS